MERRRRTTGPHPARQRLRELLPASVGVRARASARARTWIRDSSSAASERRAPPPVRISTTGSEGTACSSIPLAEHARQPPGEPIPAMHLTDFGVARDGDAAAVFDHGRRRSAARLRRSQSRSKYDADERSRRHSDWLRITGWRRSIRSGPCVRRRPCGGRVLGSLRCRERGRSAAARRGQPAELSSRDPFRDRFASRHRSVLAQRVRAGARESRGAARTQAPLIVEDTPSLYLYRLRMGAHEQTGVAGCFSLDEYERTSSRSTSGRGATRRTIARVTSSSCARRPAWSF